MRVILGAMLSGLGFPNVKFAATLNEACDLFLEYPFDLVLTDQILKDGECGLDFVRWIRGLRNPVHNMVPVIAVSSMADRQSILKAINAGIDEFLVKPLSPASLAARISAVVRKRRPFIRTKDYFGPCRRRQKQRMYMGPFRRAEDHSSSEAEEDELFLV